MTASAEQDLILDARPTKGLFIWMLIRDIQLIPAVVDLVDNSVDGARRMRRGENFDFDGLWVRLQVDEKAFRISDNCGGIPIDLARRHAFRFGRPEDMDPTPHSVGQFGVGMKRALFKLGSHFKIESTTKTESWVVDVPVEDWQRSPEWQFELSSLVFSDFATDQMGTTITVASLHPGVAKDFALQTVRTQLGEEIRHKHQDAISRGLAVSLNGLPLDVDPLELLQSHDLRPGFEAVRFSEDGTPVDVQIYVGLAEGDPQAAGWYLYCNGRLVLGPDQSAITGWGTDLGRKIPRFHPQYSRFRGFVFFDSDDASLLPWTTTKTGVDANSEIYRNVRQRMVNLMRPVIDFLNVLAREERELSAEDEEARDTLQERVDAANSVEIRTVADAAKATAGKAAEAGPIFVPFRGPSARVEARPATTSIQYRRPDAQIEKVKQALGVNTARAAGEGTFDYFYRRECE